MVRAGGGAGVSMCPSFTPPLSLAVAAAVALARPPRPGPRNHRTGAAGTGSAPGESCAGVPPEPRGRAALPWRPRLLWGSSSRAGGHGGHGGAGRAGGVTAPVSVLEPGFGSAAVRGFAEHRRRRVRCGRAAVRALMHAGPSLRAPAFLPFYGIGWLGGWAFCCFIFSRQEERCVRLKRPNGAVVVPRHRVSRRKRALMDREGKERARGVRSGAFCWRLSKIKLLVEK